MIRRYRRVGLAWTALAALTASLTTGAGAQEALLDEPDFQKGEYTIKWLEEWLARGPEAD